jgi:hypothetical protein
MPQNKHFAATNFVHFPTHFVATLLTGSAFFIKLEKIRKKITFSTQDWRNIVLRTFRGDEFRAFRVNSFNRKRVVPLWRQKAGREEERLVIWDYHVVFIYRPDDRTLVYDLDSELPFPTYFHKVRTLYFFYGALVFFF